MKMATIRRIVPPKAWSILVAWAALKPQDRRAETGPGLITYSTLGIMMGYDAVGAGRVAVRPVRHIYRFCAANDLPLLSSIVVGMDTGEPHWNDDWHPGGFEPEPEQAKVWAKGNGWFSIRAPQGDVFRRYPLSDS